MKYTEHPIVFHCENSRLLGIVAEPEKAAKIGVVIVVGGPQYRAGSHRQFTLLSRQLAEQGIASMRFDYRGMGDSEGDIRSFETVDDDIRSAIDAFLGRLPTVTGVALWGLCDAASAALYYAHTDTRVSDVILLNPWVHTEAGASRARIKHYYLSRLMQRSFWVKLLSGSVKLGDSVGDLTKSVHSAASGNSQVTAVSANHLHGSVGYIEKMLDGLNHFSGKVLFITSGRDLVAHEFQHLVSHDKKWKKACNSLRVTQKCLHDANHTFSNQCWRAQVERWTLNSVGEASGEQGK